MYETRTHSIDNRIVSISQPYVRPIVRGKAAAETEFGAKIMVSLINGFSFVDELSWDNFNEGVKLKEAIETLRFRTGYYPRVAHADTIFRNRANLEFCKQRGIRLSGPRLGRPKIKQLKAQKRLKSEGIIESETLLRVNLAKGNADMGWAVLWLSFKTPAKL